MKKAIVPITMIMLLLMTSCGEQTVENQTPSRGTTAQLKKGEFTENIGGRQIRYLISGEGPTSMVVPNSWGINIEGLRGILGNLEQQLTMVYFDPRGMGGSGPAETDEDLSMAAVRQDLEALRLHLGIERSHFIGWSNGGNNLFIYASEHPNVVRSAIFIHSLAHSDAEYFEVPEDHPLKSIFDAQDGVGQQYQKLIDELTSGDMPEEEKNKRFTEFIVNDFFTAGLPEAQADHLRELLRTAFAKTDISLRHSLYRNPERVNGWDVRDLLPKITAPVLLFYGARDLPLPEIRKKVHAGFPNATEVVLEHSGHFGPLEEPEAFADAVRDFLAGLQ